MVTIVKSERHGFSVEDTEDRKQIEVQRICYPFGTGFGEGKVDPNQPREQPYKQGWLGLTHHCYPLFHSI